VGLKSFWQFLLDFTPAIGYDMATELSPVGSTTFAKEHRSLIDFHYNTRNAKIQGLSVQVGELFADLYKDPKADSLEALEAYKSLRRLLPREPNWMSDARHIGATAAHKATQGQMA
jgi:hypothetical protein